MTIEDGDDRAIFVDAADFGVAATWTHAAVPTTVTGIFDNPHVSQAPSDIPFEGLAPSFLLPTADVPAGAAQNDTLLIAATTYKVKSLQPDGTGFTRVELAR